VRAEVALCIASGLAWQAVAVSVPWVLERVVDGGVIGGARRSLLVWTAVLVGLGLLRWAGDAARHWWVERAGAHAADHLRRRLVARLLAMGDDDLARFGHGDLTARAVGDTEAVWRWVSGIATLTTASFTLVAVVVLLVTLDPALALIGLATVPLAALFAAHRVGAHGRAAALVAAGTGAYASAVESAITGIRTIKGLGAEPVVLSRAHAATTILRVRVLNLARVEASWLAAAAAIPAAGIAVGLWSGGNRAMDGDLTVGTLVAFAGWMGLLVTATATFTERLTDRGAALGAAARLAALVAHDDRAAARARVPNVRVHIGGNDLAVDGLIARRGDRVVLRDVDLDVPLGGWLAIVGLTGAGKTTLLRLLAGLDAPVTGRIRIGGRDLSEMDGATVRRLVAFVPQGPALVSGTVGDVVGLAAPDASDADVLAALSAAGADDVVSLLGGLHGQIGDRGLTLSGGQRQRIALAAAILRRPAVLLLDDITSALDPVVEASVLRSLRVQLPGTTTVIATHRATTAAACDRCVLLADGGVVPATTAEVDTVLGPQPPGTAR
jgi:ATP-binding cassette subfamily B protein